MCFEAAAPECCFQCCFSPEEVESFAWLQGHCGFRGVRLHATAGGGSDLGHVMRTGHVTPLARQSVY